MAEIVSSAIVGETMNRIMSSIGCKDEEKSKQKENIERMEMAHIKMKAVLHVSDRWQITELPLLQWRSRLKRAAQECDDALLKCKQRALEQEEKRQRISQSPFPKRIALVTKSLISSFIGTNDEPSSSANVQRFERYAKGANEFLKTVEFGGTPWRYKFFNPLIRHLLTGESVKYQSFQDDKLYYLNIRPVSSAKRGVEALMGFACNDFMDPIKSFYVACTLRLSESTDIFDVIFRCVQPVAPHFKFVDEALTRGLVQLPTQDFTWDSPYSQGEVWVNVLNSLTQWHRPNPLCCKEHGHHLMASSRTSCNMMSNPWKLSNIFPEEVINIHLKWHIPLSDLDTNNTSSTTVVHGQSSSQNADIPTMRIGVLVIPHASPEDIKPAAESYALEIIDGKEQGMIHTNAHLQDLGEKFMPKAIEYLHQNSESETYQMFLKSRHGTAHVCLDKKSIQIQTAESILISETFHWRRLAHPRI